MATFERRGNFWRAKVRRRGCPDQTRSFNTKALAEKWARVVEFEFDHGGYVDRSVTERTTLSQILTRYAREVTPGKRGGNGAFIYPGIRAGWFVARLLRGGVIVDCVRVRNSGYRQPVTTREIGG